VLNLNQSEQTVPHKGSTAASIQMLFLYISGHINLYHPPNCCQPFMSLHPPLSICTPSSKKHAWLSSYWLLTQISIFRCSWSSVGTPDLYEACGACISCEWSREGAEYSLSWSLWRRGQYFLCTREVNLPSTLNNVKLWLLHNCIYLIHNNNSMGSASNIISSYTGMTCTWLIINLVHKKWKIPTTVPQSARWRI